MRKNTLVNEITFDIPSTSSLKEYDLSVRLKGVKGASRSQSEGFLDERIDDVLSALQQEGFEDIYGFELEADGSEENRSDEEQLPSLLNIKVGEKESAILLVEVDGVLTWVMPDEPAPSITSGGTRGNLEVEREITFRLSPDLSTSSSINRGGLNIRKAFKKIKGVVLKFVAELFAGITMKVLERKLETGLVLMDQVDPEKWKHISGIHTLSLPTDRSPKILLLVHGTFSTTLGSYGALGLTAWGRSFLEHTNKEYDAVIGYDHPTLSLDPGSNALDLYNQLTKNYSGPPLSIDTISTSRGGLVVRSLIEQVQPRLNWNVSFNITIFVASPHEGTSLADPENWRRFIDLYTNLALSSARFLGQVTGMPLVTTILSAIIKVIAALLKFLATHIIEAGLIPGLSAMSPGSEFVENLNRDSIGMQALIDTSCYVIKSNFEFELLDVPTRKISQIPGNLKKLLVDSIVDELIVDENDLVVNTRSMSAIHASRASSLPPDGFVKEICDYSANPIVHHTAYLEQYRTVVALSIWLGLPAPDHSFSQPDRSSGEEINADAVKLLKQEASIVKPTRFADTNQFAITSRELNRENLPELEISVVWGDLTREKGDIFSVGHYQGVAPISAELALDHAISRGMVDSANKNGGPKAEKEHLVLTDLISRNMISGELGSVHVIPWGNDSDNEVLAAICGMGHPGAFTENKLIVLYRKLSIYFNNLNRNRTLCTVLMGSGNGTLSIEESVRGLITGMGDTLSMLDRKPSMNQVRIVELHYDRARVIFECIKELNSKDYGLNVNLKLNEGKKDGLFIGVGGTESHEYQIAKFVIDAAKEAQKSFSTKKQEPIKKVIKGNKQEKESTLVALSALVDRMNGEEGDVSPERFAEKLGAAIRVVTQEGENNELPTRMSFLADGSVFRIAALTNNATLPERPIKVKDKLIDGLSRLLSNPRPIEIRGFSDLLYHLMVPRDFRALLPEEHLPIIFEVDRKTASIPWEMMMTSNSGEGKYIGLARPVSRQLRTGYSPPPISKVIDKQINALVIGNPSSEHPLPGAEREAQSVKNIFRRAGMHVDYLGNPTSMIEFLKLIIQKEYYIVHYAGHSNFDPQDPSSTGWIFDDGIITAGEIERLDKVPRIIISNSCLSSKLYRSEDQVSRGDLIGMGHFLPSIADEFFRRGVQHFIGTAWKINDEGAISFARHFYRDFLSSNRNKTIGEALLAARKMMFEIRREDALWAAYQHYGNPNYKFGEF